VISQRAEQLSQSLPPLLVEAERIAATVILGMHGRRRAGPGENFWQYRNYAAGDSTQRIDWHRSAKSDTIYIRDNEWEAANTLWLWSNSNARMNFKSHLATQTKRHHAQILQLAMASLATRSHERIGALGSPNQAGLGKPALIQMAKWCETENENPMPQPSQLQRQSAAVLISDFLDEPGTIKKSLTTLAQNGVRGHVLQVVDPAEETLPYSGRVEFLGLDTPAKFIANKTTDLRKDYAQAFASQRNFVQHIANRLGWSFTVHRTDQPLTATLLKLYMLVGDR
jgi:uncharacterized protein (DUF58 family)